MIMGADQDMARIRNPYYAPEFLEKRLSPSGLPGPAAPAEVAPLFPPGPTPPPPTYPPIPPDPSLPPIEFPLPPVGPAVPD